MAVRRNISNGLSYFPFHYKLKTRWKDMDAFGHMNNAVFLTYIEDARITFFKRWNLFNEKKSIIVASVKIDYLTQMKHPSNLIVGQKIIRIGSKSFDIESAVFIKDKPKPAATSTATCVCYDYSKNQSVPVYTEIIEDYENNIH